MSISVSIAGPAPTTSPWLQRLRLALIVAGGCTALTWLSGYSAFSRGYARPLVLITQLGFVTSLAASVIILGGAVLAGVTSRGDRVRDALLTAGWSLAIWASAGATMDQWLELRQPLPGPASGAPYRALLPDYALLAALTISAALLAAGRSRSAIKPSRAEWIEGLKASLITIAAATAILYFAAGPRTDITRRGQVYFAIFFSFYLAVALARHTTKVDRSIWYWPCPLIVGLIGLTYAAFRPGLPFPYDQINNIPAWGPARGLPAEMVGVGLLACLWSLRLASASPPKPAT